VALCKKDDSQTDATADASYAQFQNLTKPFEAEVVAELAVMESGLHLQRLDGRADRTNPTKKRNGLCFQNWHVSR
jgi:hypothetical protein